MMCNLRYVMIHFDFAGICLQIKVHEPLVSLKYSMHMIHVILTKYIIIFEGVKALFFVE